MTSDDIREKMIGLTDLILDAEASARSGKIMNLNSLDRDISMLCAQATKLSAEDAADIQPVMADLISSLERLSFALRDFRDGAKKQ